MPLLDSVQIHGGDHGDTSWVSSSEEEPVFHIGVERVPMLIGAVGMDWGEPSRVGSRDYYVVERYAARLFILLDHAEAAVLCEQLAEVPGPPSRCSNHLVRENAFLVARARIRVDVLVYLSP
eukprot:CAMPEP_0184484306 /NCGR_PEP_ID=MMETSP0113_2-20130426/6028_1 /TAXON_ID=91329 /ORGANISM="Norrisiella sphaerica, Strain BC52" /LENGTH=121 /DNA_ID=CAMNT_0026865245 /DNA_START=635 /DNA_END=1001 /DNA_ORIENTATION=-